MNDADFYIGKPIRSLQTMLRVIAAADEAIRRSCRTASTARTPRPP